MKSSHLILLLGGGVLLFAGLLAWEAGLFGTADRTGRDDAASGPRAAGDGDDDDLIAPADRAGTATGAGGGADAGAAGTAPGAAGTPGAAGAVGAPGGAGRPAEAAALALSSAPRAGAGGGGPAPLTAGTPRAGGGAATDGGRAGLSGSASGESAGRQITRPGGAGGTADADAVETAESPPGGSVSGILRVPPAAPLPETATLRFLRAAPSGGSGAAAASVAPAGSGDPAGTSAPSEGTAPSAMEPPPPLGGRAGVGGTPPPAAAGPVEPRFTVQPDESGAFAVGPVPPGRYALEVSAAGYRPRLLGPLTVAPGAALTDLVAELEPIPGRLRGEVTDAATGRPVAGALVFLDDDRRKSFTHVPGEPIPDAVATDDAGLFVLREVPPGEHLVGVLARGYAFQVARGVAVRGAEETRVPALALETGAALECRVLDEQEQPIPKQDVTVRSRFEEVRRARTDRQGRVAFEHLAPGRYTVVTARGADGRTQRRQQAVDLAADQRRAVVLRFSGADVTGVLVGQVTRGGQPAAAPVVAAMTTGGVRREFTTESDAATGRFELPELPAGPCTVTVRRLRYQVEIVAGAEVPLYVELPANAVQGRVFEVQSERPVAGARVAFQLLTPLDPAVQPGAKGRVTTDAEGAFSMKNLPGGAYRLTAEREGYRPAALERVVVPEEGLIEGLALFLEGGASIIGTVADEAGAPLPEARVVLLDAAQRTVARAVTDRAGGFGFARLGAEVYAVRVTKPEYLDGWEQGVALLPGEARELRLVLRRGATLIVRVADERGRALAGARVRLTNSLGEQRGAQTAAEKDGGAARFSPLPDDVYRVEVSLKGYRPAVEESLLMERGETRTLNVMLARTGR